MAKSMDSVTEILQARKKALTAELATIDQMLRIAGSKASAGPGRSRGRRKLSAAARKAISDAQKRRWAAQRAGKKA
jgi:hypothetical protein